MKTTKELRAAMRAMPYGNTIQNWCNLLDDLDEAERERSELTRQRDEAIARAEQYRKNYYDLADAICRESSSVEDACRQARALRAEVALCKRALERVRLSDASGPNKKKRLSLILSRKLFKRTV